jgi:hypothetical protein
VNGAQRVHPGITVTPQKVAMQADTAVASEQQPPATPDQGK